MVGGMWVWWGWRHGGWWDGVGAWWVVDVLGAWWVMGGWGMEGRGWVGVMVGGLGGMVMVGRVRAWWGGVGWVDGMAWLMVYHIMASKTVCRHLPAWQQLHQTE